MRTVLCGVALVAALQAQAAVIADWGFTIFPDGNDDASNPYDASSVSSDLSSASLQVNYGGSVALITSTTAGNGGGGIRLAGTGTAINGSTLTFTLQAVSGASIPFEQLTFDYRLSDVTQSPTSIAWGYQIVGGASGSLGTSTLTDSAWNSTFVDLAPSGINLGSSQSLIITGTLGGGGTGSGNISFDNFSLTPVPEPVHLALGLFGLVFAGTTAWRSYFRRK